MDGGAIFRPEPDARDVTPSETRPLAPLAAALDRVAGERDELVTELQAFERFARRVAETEPEIPRVGPLGLTDPAKGTSSARARIRRAYEETVMAMSHYDRVYDEPYCSNVAAELSEAVAVALCSDAGGFTPTLQAAVVEAAQQARSKRESFMGHLDHERDALETSREALEAIELVIDRYEDDLSETSMETLATLDECLETVATTRQTTIHDQPWESDVDNHDFCAYLYEDEPWTYPVLTAVTALRARVDGLRERIAYGR